MAKFHLPTIEQNNLFTPSFMIFAGLCSYLVFSQSYKDAYNLYQPLIGFACMFFLLASFIFTFYSLEVIRLKNQKPVLFWVNGILLVGQFFSIYRAIESLQNNAIPTNALIGITSALCIFLFQTFLNKEIEKFYFLIYLTVVTAIISILLYVYPDFLVIVLTNRLNILFLQVISLFLVSSNAFLFLVTIRKYIKLV